jgi:hypothetical protein
MYNMYYIDYTTYLCALHEQGDAMVPVLFKVLTQGMVETLKDEWEEAGIQSVGTFHSLQGHT